MQRASLMVLSLRLREQAERCRCLARDCTDEQQMRDNLLGLAEEYLARAVVLETGQDSIRDAGLDDPDA